MKKKYEPNGNEIEIAATSKQVGNDKTHNQETTVSSSVVTPKTPQDESSSPTEGQRSPDSLINEARRYLKQKRVVVPLSRADVQDRQRAGKAPVLKKADYPTLDGCDEAYLKKWWDGPRPQNLGVMLEKPYVVIDLDAKADQGASVDAWLEKNKAAASWPRERTRGGVHLHVRCEMPEGICSEGGNRCVIERRLTDEVNAEIFFGGVITVSPSEHRDGHVYHWVAEGEPPTLNWDELCAALGVDPSPIEKKRASKRRGYKGDLRTLDIIALCKELGIYGQLIDPEEGKHAVKCPWHESHSDSHEAWRPDDASTVIWETDEGDMPGFCCLHASHGKKSLTDFLEWAECQIKGIVDKHCTREWVGNDLHHHDGKPFIQLPRENRLMSDFAADVGEVMKPKHDWFVKGNTVVAVSLVREAVKRKFDKELDPDEVSKKKFVEWTAFVPVEKHAAVSAIETHLTPGVYSREDGEDGDEKVLRAVPKSMSVPMTQTLLESAQLKSRLPQLERIFEVPLPLIDPDTGDLACPKRGYDERFCSFLVKGELEIREMSLGEAKRIVERLLMDFCFRGEQDVIHAIAALITPLCRGLYDRWTSRTPMFFFLGNRPRTGKDYLAGCISILYEGRTNEDPPLDSDQGELRKKLTSAMMSGRRRMHFSNCNGVLDNPVLEQVVTNERWSDRVLGGNTEVTVPNEMEFSLSGNTGVIYTPDFSARTRIINLHFSDEHENQRTFSRPDLHGWLLQNRAEVLSALWTFIKVWNESGRPEGVTPFTSFPSWASTVGGIMHACELGDPCRPCAMEMSTGGDSETRDMKRLFGMAYEMYPEKWIVKNVVRKLVEDNHNDDNDEPLFGYLDIGDQSGRIRFGRILDKFVGREFDGIQMLVDTSTDRSARHKLKYTKKSPDRSDVEPITKVFGVDLSRTTEVSTPDTGDSGSLGSSGSLVTSAMMGEEEKSDSIPGDKNTDEPVDTANTTDTATFVLVENAKCFPDIAKQIRLSGQPVALDCETYGEQKGAALNPIKGKIRLISLAIPGHKPWVIDAKATGLDLGLIATALEKVGTIIHNGLFDLRFLAAHCKLGLTKVECTMTASKLLKAGLNKSMLKASNKLGDLLTEYGIVDLPKDQGESAWGGDLSAEQLEYAANDVLHLHTLRDKLVADIDRAGMSEVWRLEMELLPIAVSMNVTGIFVDAAKLDTLAEDLIPVIEAHESEACRLLKKVINLNSPLQLKPALIELGLAVEKTDKATLTELDHPVAASILNYRKFSSEKAQLKELEKHIASDGRVHGTFKPTGGAAGRFSCSDPNLQGIGRGAVREAFIAPEGSKLVCADYSQIELRIAAVLRGEEKMLEAFRNGEDLHRQTAALVLEKEISEVTLDERQMAKAVNFGLLYGQAAPGLARFAKRSYGVDMSESEAETFRNRFFESYPAMASYDKQARGWANGWTEVTTKLGRRRHLPTGADEWWDSFTQILNTPVQGGGADVLKTALVKLSKALPKEARIVSTIHDEIIVECPNAFTNQVKQVMETEMVAAMQELYPEVPCPVEANIGKTWAEAK